jgi:uroporphyrinogen-III decarboxylase
LQESENFQTGEVFMTNKERFIKTLSFENVDRIPIMDFGYWRETIEVWHSQGLPDCITTDSQVEEFCGLDKGFELCMLNGVRRSIEKAAIFRIYPKFAKVIVEESEDSITCYNEEGVLIKESKSSGSMPQILKNPVENISDFENLLPRLDANNLGRKRENYNEIIREAKNTMQPVGLWVDGFYAWPRELMGVENLSIAFIEKPELIHAINKQHLDFVKKYIELFFSEIDLDYICCFEDMAFKSGMFLSPKMFKQFMAPYYENLIDFLRKRKVKKILFDSDGNTIELCGLFSELGMDCHYPLEINSGSYPEQLRELYPNLALIGGIDKKTLISGRETIDKELSKIPKLLDKGGYIPTVDHRVPPDVTFDNYKYYVEKKKEIISKCFNS